MSPQCNAFSRYRQFTANRFRELAWSVLFALVLGMSQAQAISLGEIRVASHLGQPLDAVVHINPAPGEVLTANCFSAEPTQAAELPGIANIKLALSRSVSPMALRLRTREPVREPLSEIVLRVRCPGVPSITRTFWVMVDPQGISDTRFATAAESGGSDTAAQVAGNRRPAAANSLPAANNRTRVASGGERVRVYAAYTGPRDPIVPGETYIVRDGDVLSMIASRVAGRESNTVWAIAEKIFRLNPAAFMSGDPDMLVAGSQIYVPLLASPAGQSPVATAPAAKRPGIRTSNLAEPAPVALQAMAPASPVAAGSVAAPLPVMVLSRSLSALSVSRIQQRRSGVLALPQAPVTTQQGVAGSGKLAAGASGQKLPEVPQEQSSPDVAVTPPKAAVAPAQASTQSNGFGWAAFFGLMVLVLFGAALAMFAFRRKVTRAYRDDLRKALRRRRYADELVRSRQQVGSADSSYSVTETEAETDDGAGWAKAQAATETDSPPAKEMPAGLPAGPSAMLADLLDSDRTVKVKSPAEALDLEFPEMTNDVALPVPPDDSDLTLELETANGAPELDLELPDLFSTTAASDEPPAEPAAATSALDGMEELEFDPELLALDYSKEYEASRLAENTPAEVAGENELTIDGPAQEKPAGSKPAGDGSEYYHLEAEVDADTAAGDDELSFDNDEDADDELSFDNDEDDDDKVVQFPQKQSGQ